MSDSIDRIDTLKAIEDYFNPNHNTDELPAELMKFLVAVGVIIFSQPPVQSEPDWDYSEETKQITLIVPEDVYNSAETVFLSVGYEGTFGIRGMVYSAQPERKRGKWNVTDAYPHNVYCSECHKRFAQTHWAVWEDGSLPRNFCPNCGADMRGDQNE